jgi:hypothetical protein
MWWPAGPSALRNSRAVRLEPSENRILRVFVAFPLPTPPNTSVPLHPLAVHCYFTGKVAARAAPRSTQAARSLLVLCPSAETITQPFIGFPVMSNCLVLGSFNESVYSCAPTRTMRSSFKTPQAMFPPSRKQTPPNIFFSLKPGLPFRSALTLSESFLSYPIRFHPYSSVVNRRGSVASVRASLLASTRCRLHALVVRRGAPSISVNEEALCQ